jgi:hypothetical protein
MARFLADENFDYRIVRTLRPLGHEIVTLPHPDLAPAGAPDRRVVAIAAAERRAGLTHNRHDFVRLHRRSTTHAGIIVVSPDPNIEAVARRIDSAVGGHADLDGQLLRVNLPNP